MRRSTLAVVTAALGVSLVLGGLAFEAPPAGAQQGLLQTLTQLVSGLLGATLRSGPWTVVIPAGAFNGTTRVSMHSVPVRALAVSLDLADPTLNHFNKPVLLTWHSANPAGALNKTIYWWSPQDMRWEEVPGTTANPVTGDVTAPLEHFSIYAVGGKAGW